MDATTGIPPAVTDETAPFWDAAGDGLLVAERCTSCGTHVFPPRGICRSCRSRDLEWVELRGPGTVYSFTVNHQRWRPEMEVPFAIVLVDLADAPGVRVAGRVRGCTPDEVHVGMTVDVGFEPGPDGFAVPSFVARAVG